MSAPRKLIVTTRALLSTLGVADPAHAGNSGPVTASSPGGRTRKPVARSLTVAAVALAAAAFTTTSAHAATASHAGALAEVYPDRVAQICDTQTDGNGAFVTILRADGLKMNYFDGTGHDNVCGGPFYPSSPIVEFKVCEDNTGCSGWIKP